MTKRLRPSYSDTKKAWVTQGVISVYAHPNIWLKSERANFSITFGLRGYNHTIQALIQNRL